MSGQIALDPKTGNLVQDDIKTETQLVMENLKAILSAAGMDFSNIIKTTIFLMDMGQFAQVNEVYGSYFSEAGSGPEPRSHPTTTGRSRSPERPSSRPPTSTSTCPASATSGESATGRSSCSRVTDRLEGSGPPTLPSGLPPLSARRVPVVYWQPLVGICLA
ncbi:MAG: Rid family hydrolase [Acidimicrobiales bacterium]